MLPAIIPQPQQPCQNSLSIKIEISCIFHLCSGQIFACLHMTQLLQIYQSFGIIHTLKTFFFSFFFNWGGGGGGGAEEGTVVPAPTLHMVQSNCT